MFFKGMGDPIRRRARRDIMFHDFIRRSGNGNRSNNSTDVSENSNAAKDFIRENTRNIIIDNKQEISLEVNINNLNNILPNKDNKIPGPINLGQIHLSIDSNNLTK
jgi:hypothetical protein